jgi:hypothetical protein
VDDQQINIMALKIILKIQGVKERAEEGQYVLSHNMPSNSS